MVGDYSILISIYEIPIIRTQPATPASMEKNSQRG
jgi:hypothetical protein